MNTSGRVDSVDVIDVHGQGKNALTVQSLSTELAKLHFSRLRTRKRQGDLNRRNLDLLIENKRLREQNEALAKKLKTVQNAVREVL